MDIIKYYLANQEFKNMKLLYLWKPKVGNLEFNKGFNFSPEYNVKFSRDACELQIFKNEDYIKNFYSKNIYEVTAIVGSNGCGKTTLAMYLAKELGTLNSFVEIPNFKTKEFIHVYKKGEELHVYYYLNDEVLKCSNEKTQCYDIRKLSNSVEFKEKYKAYNITTVYVSNVFDASNLKYGNQIANSEMYESNNNLFYSPVANINTSNLRKKNWYGSGTQGNVGRLISSISRYENCMSEGNQFSAVINYTAELFIRSYLNMPNTIKEKLDIFKEYKFGVHKFGSYLELIERKTDEFDEYVKKIINKFEKFDVVNQFFFKQCFINVLCEADLYFGIEKNKERSTVGRKIDKLLEKEEIEIDVDILKSIDAYACSLEDEFGKKNYINSGWIQQLRESINVFEKNKNSKVKTAERNAPIKHLFGEKNDDILKFFLEESEKNFSFFKRYFIFELITTSSGEYALTSIFSYIDDALSKKNKEDILLIIDEIDVYLHPTWQQIILKNLIYYIEQRHSDKNFQIIFTTHSPIILSDMTSDRVIKLKREIDCNKVDVISCEKLVFGANIERLFYDNFFMENGNIGEIAKEKIRSVLKYIKDKENGNSDSSILEPMAKYIISNIGEPTVKNKLNQRLERLNENQDYINLDSLISKIGKNEVIHILKKHIDNKE